MSCPASSKLAPPATFGNFNRRTCDGKPIMRGDFAFSPWGAASRLNISSRSRDRYRDQDCPGAHQQVQGDAVVAAPLKHIRTLEYQIA